MNISIDALSVIFNLPWRWCSCLLQKCLQPELYKELVAVNKAAWGRPRLEKPKQAIKLRLDVEIIEAFKSTGEGWQTRINALLKKEAKKISHA